MSLAAKTTNGKRRNNFGSLRLLFALCVIVSHSPEIVDGDRSRELLTRVFGTMSFGELGVDGFFLISAYLITKSFVTRRSIEDYFYKRVLRIFPGYFVNFVLCVFVLAPFVVAHQPVWTPKSLGAQAWALLHLAGPIVPGVFEGLHHAALNGSLWTIAYEFRCYMITIALGLTGAYSVRGRWVLFAGVAGCLLLTAGGVLTSAHWHGEAELERPEYLVRFFGIYGVGALYYLFRDAIPVDGKGAVVAVLLPVACLFNATLAVSGWTIFGG